MRPGGGGRAARLSTLTRVWGPVSSACRRWQRSTAQGARMQAGTRAWTKAAVHPPWLWPLTGLRMETARSTTLGGWQGPPPPPTCSWVAGMQWEKISSSGGSSFFRK